MSAAPKPKMTADEFLAWANGREERWELVDCAPTLMAPERAIHALTKFAAQRSLDDAIARTGSPCRMFPNGMTVRVDAANAFEPDALVVCGGLPPAEAIEVANPVIVVEVLSPSTAANDHGLKLSGYFSLASVQHYLILDPDRRVLIHHKRGQGEAIETRILSEGVLRLDPPGLEVAVSDMFAAQ
jgi:Uma2 family endonuclease